MPRKTLLRLEKSTEPLPRDFMAMLGTLSGDITDIEIINTAIEKGIGEMVTGLGEDGLVLQKLRDIDTELKQMR